MPEPGTRLGDRYRLDQRIGAGGMGEVWRATDELLGRTVAVKVMLPALLREPGFARRFLVEAQAMASVSHPGVVAIHDYHSDQNTGTAFLVAAELAEAARSLDPSATGGWDRDAWPIKAEDGTWLLQCLAGPADVLDSAGPAFGSD